MTRSCIDYVKDSFPYPMPPAWIAWIEMCCRAGTHPWVIVFVMFDMLQPDKIPPPAHEQRLKEKLANSIGANGESATTCATRLIGRPLDLDIWQAHLQKLRDLFPDYDLQFLVSMFNEFSAGRLDSSDKLKAFVIYYKSRPARTTDAKAAPL